MKRGEYTLSLLLALLMVIGAAAWTYVGNRGRQTDSKCEAGTSARVFLKGLSLFPTCPEPKRG
ncbi:MAG: hypothetical protein ACT4QD_07975 [Acidobacteriota bacterium]